jgi:hypothetical protein
VLERARDYHPWRERQREEHDDELESAPLPGKRSLIEMTYGRGAAPAAEAPEVEPLEPPERLARGIEPIPEPARPRAPVPAAGPPLLPIEVGQFVQARQAAARGAEYRQAVQPEQTPKQTPDQTPERVPVPVPARERAQARVPAAANAAAGEQPGDPMRRVLEDFDAGHQRPKGDAYREEAEIPGDLEGQGDEALDDLAEELDLELPADATLEQKRKAIEAARASRQGKALKGIARRARKVAADAAADQRAIEKQGKTKAAGRGAQGKAAAGAARAANAVRTFARAKNIDELKARLRKVMEEDKAKLDAELRKSTEELGVKMKAERKKVADELAALEKKLAGEIAAKEKEIAGQIEQKLADARNRAETDRKQAQATTETEKRRRRDAAAAAARRLDNEGDKQGAAAARSRGEQAAKELDGKLAVTLEKIGKAETEGAANLEVEKEKLLTEARARAKAAGEEAGAKHDAAVVKINLEEQGAGEKLKQANEGLRKGALEKFDAQMKKLETGQAKDLAALETETNKIIGEIDMEVMRFQAVAQAQIRAAQQAAAREAGAAIDRIKQEGARAAAAIDELARQAMARVDQQAAERAARQAAVADEGQRRLTADTPEEAAAVEREAAAREKAELDKVEAAAAAKAAAEKKIDEAAAELADELDGDEILVDEEAILEHLRGKTPEQIAAIKKAYFDKTKRQLDADLDKSDALDKTELKEAKAHLSDDPVQRAVATLENAEDGWSTDADEQRIKETLAKLDPETRKKVAAEYEKQTGRRLNSMLEDELDEADAKNARLPEEPTKKVDVSKEVKDSPAVAQAVAKLRGATDRWDTDEKGIYEALKGKTPEEIEAIKQVWNQNHGPPGLDEVLEKEMSGTELKEAKAMMSDDPVRKAVASLHNATDGPGTDVDKVQKTLESIKDPELRAQVAAEFEKETGQKLEATLTEELSGRDLDKAEAAAAGDFAALRAIQFDEAKNGNFLADLSDTMADTLGVDRDTMRILTDVAVFAAMTATGPVGFLLGAALLAHEHIDLHDDENAMYQVLEQCETPEERKAMEEAYNKKFAPRTLRGEIAKLDGAEVDVATALLDGDKTRARAAKVKAGSEQWGWADKDLMFSAIEECESKEERDALIAEFNRRYGAAAGGTDFQGTIAESFKYNDLDREKARQLTEDGKMNDAFALYYAQHAGLWGSVGIGIGTDEEAIAKILKGKSKEDIAEIKRQYAALAKSKGREPDLEKSLDDETSGRPGKQIDILLRGEPTTAAEAQARYDEMAEFEREDVSGWAIDAVALFLLGPINAPLWLIARVAGLDTDGMAKGAVDCWNDSAEDLAASQARLKGKLAELERTMKRNPGESDADFEKRKLDAFKVELAREQGYLETYQANKDETADVASTAVSLVVTGALSIATGGAAAWACAAIGGLAGIGAKAAILGGAYELEDFGMDLVEVAAEAIAAGVAKGVELDDAIKGLRRLGTSEKLIKRILKEALEEAIENGTSELILALFNEDNYKSLEAFLFGVSKAVAQAALSGAVAAAVMVTLNDVFDAVLKDKVRKAAWSTLKGAISEGVGGLAASAVDPSTWEGTMEEVFRRFGAGFIDNILSAGAEGLGESVGHGANHGKLADTRKRLAEQGASNTHVVSGHVVDFDSGRVFDADGKEIGRIEVDPQTGLVTDVTDPANPVPIGVNENLKGKKVGGTGSNAQAGDTQPDPDVAPDTERMPDTEPAPTQPMPTPPVFTGSPTVQGGVTAVDPSQQTEGGPTHKLHGQASDGKFGWTFSADVTEANGAVKFTVRIFLDPQGSIADGDLERFQANVMAGVDTHFNQPGFQLVGPSGRPGVLGLDVQFTSDRSNAHLVVDLHPGDGPATMNKWFVDGSPTMHAHELGHAAFGLIDEYGAADTPDRPVHADGSLMGDFWTRDKDGNVIAAPGTSLKPRHLAQISALLQGGSGKVSDTDVDPDAQPDTLRSPEQPPDPDAKLAAAMSQTPEQRKLILGTDPAKGFQPHEGEVGPLIEAQFGFFERDPSSAGEWISLSGPHFGEVFDLVGIPPDRAALVFSHPKAPRFWREFKESISDHFLKSIDRIVIDMRALDAARRQEIRDFIDANHGSDKGKVIFLE